MQRNNNDTIIQAKGKEVGGGHHVLWNAQDDGRPKIFRSGKNPWGSNMYIKD